MKRIVKYKCGGDEVVQTYIGSDTAEIDRIQNETEDFITQTWEGLYTYEVLKDETGRLFMD